jgi:hypothetical protein
MKMVAILLTWLFILGAQPSTRANDTDWVLVALTQVQFVLKQAFDRLQHLAEMAKYVQMIDNQIQQINQLTSVVNQSVEQLRRFGDPNDYINMLGLDQLLAEMRRLENGVGKTVADFRQAADGIAAIKNTSLGLYQDLSTTPDRFGRDIQYDIDRFKEFGVVQDMYQDFNDEVQAANNSLKVLQDEKAQTLRQLNAATSLIEVQKFQTKLQAIQSSLDNVLSRTIASSQKVLVQEAANRNDKSRRAEALRQQRVQETIYEDQQLIHATADIVGPATGGKRDK